MNKQAKPMVWVSPGVFQIGKVPVQLIEDILSVKSSPWYDVTSLFAAPFHHEVEYRLKTLGYRVHREYKCSYTNASGKIIRGRADLAVIMDEELYLIELDNGSVRHKSYRKIYESDHSGLVILRKLI